ncbi:hypothetical protein WMY93_002781 [Mugilogobius chulae]|uniref:Vesicle-trafficking protein SEC22a/c C-terminal domain-containing protein n=1 Tax=Mugilogobius chulae TaxID=88201 RepID=A0AAW0Q343_9GOBI
MSMVVFASVVRIKDGLPLSASTDYEQDAELHETKRHLKTLSKKLPQLPDRCSLKSGSYNFTSGAIGSSRLVCVCCVSLVFVVTYVIRRVRWFFSKKFFSTPTQMLEPVSLSGIVSCVLTVLCGGLNLLRGVHAIESILQNDGEDFNYVIAFFLGTAACIYQCFLFAYFSVWRNSKSFLAFALICLSNMYLYELRNVWQILFHVAVGAFMTLQIRLRRPIGKAPDYNV